MFWDVFYLIITINSLVKNFTCRIVFYCLGLPDFNNSSKSQKLSTMSEEDLSLYTLPNDQPIVVLDCQTAFDALSANEKLYAHYLSQACWYGGLIVLVQTSPESPLIFSLIHKIFAIESIPDLKKSALASGITDDEFTVSINFNFI